MTTNLISAFDLSLFIGESAAIFVMVMEYEDIVSHAVQSKGEKAHQHTAI